MKAIAGIAAAAAVAIGCVGGTVVLGVIAVTGYMSGGDSPITIAAACTTTSTQTQVVAASTTAKLPAGYTHDDQVANARTIITVGQQMGIPPRGWIIAVATAMQESTLHNEANTAVPRSMSIAHVGAGHDHDSVGLFQQRPNPPDGAGSWGTVTELMDPATSARKFYTALQRVPDWQGLPLSAAAQKVQRSAFPGAYAKHETDATAVVDALTGDHTVQLVNSVGQCAQPGQVTAGGWTQPVLAKIGSPYGPRGGRLHAGVDLMAPKHTPIRAAADGTVVEAHCDAATAAVWSCDKDGQVVNGTGVTPGCGWMVDIRHADGVETRYCHMVVAPLVHVGDHVAAGQQIGWSGSSGSSSGPHLHFEVHTGLAPADRAVNANSTDPVPFMRQHGAPLGTSTTA